MKLALLLLLSLSISVAFGQEERSPYHYVGAFGGQSVITFGSSQYRTGGGILYGYAKPEPRFGFGNVKGDLVYEGYLDHTYGYHSRPLEPSDAVGVLGFSRWQTSLTKGGLGAYFEFGWGFQFADRATHDLPSDLNSTPWGGVGLRFPLGGSFALFGLRFIHISNAGLVTPNRGQDELFLTFQYRV